MITESSRAEVVALCAHEDHADLFFHDGGSFRCETIPFRPFALTAAPPQSGEYTELSGTLPLRYLQYGAELKGNYSFRDWITPALILSGVRLFAGMDFSELRRMQLLIEGGKKKLDSLSFRINGKTVQLTGDEKKQLSAFLHAVEEFDPDVIEGYGLFDHDLEVLSEAAKRNKVQLQLLPGRGGTPLSVSRSSIAVGDRRINYRRCDCPGRHLIDLQQMVMLHDVIKRDMEGYSFSEAVTYFGLTSPVPLENLEEIGGLLEPAFFYLTQLIPVSFQDAVVRGNGMKIDLLFAGLYLKANHSLPFPEQSRFYPGALSRAKRSGLFAPVWHCDVRSLYPSILLAEQWAPSRDELKLFPQILGELRKFRLDAKDKMRKSTGAERSHYAALQAAFKIVINSFYGYLGFAQGSFNDYDLAEKVTARGREILGILTAFLESQGAVIIEMDTDGVYFKPPQNREPEEFEAAVQAALPPCIAIELDSVNPAMYSYKAKNYAILTGSGEVELTGAALKSRGMEPYFRKLLKEIMRLRLTGREAEFGQLKEKAQQEIGTHEIPLSELCKSETLNDSTANYKKKLESGTGRRSAAYELLLKANRTGKVGDQVKFYLTGDKAKPAVVDSAKLLEDAGELRDENTLYYRSRCEELFKNFAE